MTAANAPLESLKEDDQGSMKKRRKAERPRLKRPSGKRLQNDRYLEIFLLKIDSRTKEVRK